MEMHAHTNRIKSREKKKWNAFHAIANGLMVHIFHFYAHFVVVVVAVSPFLVSVPRNSNTMAKWTGYERTRVTNIRNRNVNVIITYFDNGFEPLMRSIFVSEFLFFSFSLALCAFRMFGVQRCTLENHKNAVMQFSQRWFGLVFPSVFVYVCVTLLLLFVHLSVLAGASDARMNVDTLKSRDIEFDILALSIKIPMIDENFIYDFRVNRSIVVRRARARIGKQFSEIMIIPGNGENNFRLEISICHECIECIHHSPDAL